MRELLDEIDRLEREPLQQHAEEATSGETSAASASLNSRLEGLRSQLQGLMEHALELEEEISKQDPVLASRRRESRVSLPVADGDLVNQNPRDERAVHEITLPHWPESPQGNRREVADEAGSQGISIRLIPPEPPDAEGHNGSTDVTLVFDLGPRQAPIRVTLPLENHIREYSSNRSASRSEVAPRPFPVAMVGVAALAIVLIGVWFVSAVWAGMIAPRAVTATSQIEQSTPTRIPQTPAIGGESRPLHEQPSTQAPILASIANGTRVEVLDGAEFAEGFHWLRVRTADGKVGWVASAVQRSTISPGDSSTPTPEPER